jgi:hypothetical protein
MADEPLTETDRIIARATEEFLKRIPEIEQAIAEQVLKAARKLTNKNGLITAKDEVSKRILLGIERDIIERIAKTEYDSEIAKLITNFDAVEQNAIQLQLEYSDLKVDPTQISANNIKKWAIDNTIYTLKEGGFKYNVIQPLTESLTRVVILGGNLSDLEKEVVGKTNGILKNYAGGVVRDLFSQYEGVVQKKIEVEYDLNAYLYVGGLKKTSRPQCKKWVKMGVILIKDLEEEIAWAERNGTGMIQNTTPGTFAIYRGGWGCLHKAIPTRR